MTMTHITIIKIVTVIITISTMNTLGCYEDGNYYEGDTSYADTAEDINTGNNYIDTGKVNIYGTVTEEESEKMIEEIENSKEDSEESSEGDSEENSEEETENFEDLEKESEEVVNEDSEEVTEDSEEVVDEDSEYSEEDSEVEDSEKPSKGDSEDGDSEEVVEDSEEDSDEVIEDSEEPSEEDSDEDSDEVIEDSEEPSEEETDEDSEYYEEDSDEVIEDSDKPSEEETDEDSEEDSEETEYSEIGGVVCSEETLYTSKCVENIKYNCTVDLKTTIPDLGVYYDYKFKKGVDCEGIDEGICSEYPNGVINCGIPYDKPYDREITDDDCAELSFSSGKCYSYKEEAIAGFEYQGTWGSTYYRCYDGVIYENIPIKILPEGETSRIETGYLKPIVVCAEYGWLPDCYEENMGTNLSEDFTCLDWDGNYVPYESQYN